MQNVHQAPPLLVERAGDTVTLTLARPDRLNALDACLVEHMIEAFETADRDGTRLIVVTGQGKGFSGGFDLSDLAAQSDGDLALRFLRIESLLQLIHHAPCATLALVHGACFGAGADIVAACALRLAAPDSRFRLPGLRFGVALGTRRLAELVGRDTALSLLMTAREFSSEDALAAGLLTEISAKADWPERVAAAAAAAAVLPSDSLTSLLRLTRADHRDADLAALARSVAVPGLKNRIAAYLASRSPS